MDDEKMIYPESRELFRNLLNQLLGGRSASRSDSNYTFRPYDGVVLFTSSSAITATIPADTYALNYVLTGVQFGAGTVTFAAGDGVTFVSKDDPVVTAGQYTLVTAKQVSENVWLLCAMESGGSGGGGFDGDDFGNDPNTTAGLIYGVKGGKILFDANADFNVYDPGTVTLYDNTVNNLYLCPDLGSDIATAVVVSNASASPATSFPKGLWLLANVTTSGGQITDITDLRGTIFAAFSSNGILSDLSFIKVITDDPDNPGVITVILKAGYIQTPSGSVRVAPVGGLVIQDNATNYVEVDVTGTLSTNTDGFTPGRGPLMTVLMTSGVLFTVTDCRGFLYVPGEPASVGVTSITASDGLSVDHSTGAVTISAITLPKHFLATGGPAGDITCTGITNADRLDQVIAFVGAGTAVTNILDLTSEFGIGSNDIINNDGGTDTTGSLLLVNWRVVAAAA